MTIRYTEKVQKVYYKHFVYENLSYFAKFQETFFLKFRFKIINRQKLTFFQILLRLNFLKFFPENFAMIHEQKICCATK